MKRIIIPALLISITFLSTACHALAGAPKPVQRESSMASYLFGGCAPLKPAERKPLEIPAKVAVAFVPGDPATASIPETVKKEAMDSVSNELSKHSKYITSVQRIPSSYLRPKGGIGDLENVSKQFDVDVIVLLSASQYQRDERKSLAALLDLTIVGYFLLPGTAVDTATVIEAAVYHVPSRSLIFRADGDDTRKSYATGYGTTGKRQVDAISSISDASKKLVISIGKALAKFESFDVKNAVEIQPQQEKQTGSAQPANNYWNRVSQYRSTGGGSFETVWLLICGGALACAAAIRSKR